MRYHHKYYSIFSSENESSRSSKNIEGYIIVTGAAGFIGSCTVQFLNDQGYENLILVDDFGVEEKRKNWEGKKYAIIVERHSLFEWLKQHEPNIEVIIHLGARTDTAEFDYSVHQKLNVDYSEDIWNYCTKHKVPLIYASSAATYGDGQLGYDDDHDLVKKLLPLNPYGISKNEFDKWALKQNKQPPFWAGLKFFNVYGPNEYHKGRMASMVFHSYNQVKKNGTVKLFKSYKEGYLDGEQLRDFIYVKDVVKVIYWIIKRVESKKLNDPELLRLEEERLKDQRIILDDGGGEVDHEKGEITSGIYNLGTGKAQTFNHLVNATFAATGIPPNISYIDMPEDIKDKYQYFTEGNMNKLRAAGYKDEFYNLEAGVEDYVREYLMKDKFY